MKKIKPADLKGFVIGEHQPFTDYNQEIVDWLGKNAYVGHNWADDYSYIFTDRDGYFYTHDYVHTQDIYILHK